MSINPIPQPVEIVVTQVDLRGCRSRLGIDAPDNVVIHRQEVWDAIGAQHTASASDDVVVAMLLGLVAHLQPAQAIMLLGQASHKIFMNGKRGGEGDQIPTQI